MTPKTRRMRRRTKGATPARGTRAHGVTTGRNAKSSGTNVARNTSSIAKSGSSGIPTSSAKVRRQGLAPHDDRVVTIPYRHKVRDEITPLERGASAGVRRNRGQADE